LTVEDGERSACKPAEFVHQSICSLDFMNWRSQCVMLFPP
jgi:hypothetical protein